MPFPFVYVCDLLEDLANLYNRVIPLLPKDLDHRTTEITLRWLKHHRNLLDAAATDDDCVILTLQPEKRADRVYGLDAFALEQIVARVLNLPKQHYQDLQRWRHGPAEGDLASCVEQVMENMAAVSYHDMDPAHGTYSGVFIEASKAPVELPTDVPFQAKNRVAVRAKAYAATVEQIDQSLLRVASHNKSSSAEVRSLALDDNDYDTIDILGELYRCLTSRESKWLTRLILKDFGPVKFPDSLTCQSNHSFLPRCVQVRAQFSSSMPAALRRDGPGSLRLADALKAASSVLATPPSTALEPLSLTAQNIDRRTGCVSQIAKVKTAPPMKERSRQPGDQNALNNLDQLNPGPFFIREGECLLAEETCPLTNCLFILAPCISTSTWLIEKLLPWHGVSYVASLQAVSGLDLPTRSPQTRKKYRKVALVDTYRPTETAEFLKQIGNLKLKSPQGEKQWVEVYDWRILECIGKIDLGKELTYDPWRRCWIGAV
jgi:hypothetical protein